MENLIYSSTFYSIRNWRGEVILIQVRTSDFSGRGEFYKFLEIDVFFTSNAMVLHRNETFCFRYPNSAMPVLGRTSARAAEATISLRAGRIQR